MDSVFHKNALYDFLSILVPGSLLLLWVDVSFSPNSSDITCENCGFFSCVLIFVACYALGSFAKLMGEMLFCSLLRNRDKDLRNSLEHSDINGDISEFVTIKGKGVDEFRREYYKYYYVAVNGRRNTAIPVLEAKVAFLRSMLAVFPVYILSADSWTVILPNMLQSDIWGAILFVLAVLTFREMFRMQNDVYRLVWEDAYYAIKANGILKQIAEENG